MPAIMFPSSSSDLVHAIDCDLKQSPGHLFVRQPHTIQIIQLVEGPPPPPRPIESVIQTSSAGSSSASSCPTSSDEDCSSYCSSVITPDHSAPVQWTDDTYSTRMKRVHAWRDGFVKATSTCPVSEPRPPSLKRKTHPPQTEDDSISHTSKRSRSRLTGHPCPACDAHFSSLSSLRRHGRAPDVPEACRAAVEYNFE